MTQKEREQEQSYIERELDDIFSYAINRGFLTYEEQNRVDRLERERARYNDASAL